MNFLRNTFSSFPYYQEKTPIYSTGLWDVYAGSSKKDNNVKVCIFIYKNNDISTSTNTTDLIFKNAKQLRLPGLVKVLDVFPDSNIIVTEQVFKLHLNDDAEKTEDSIALGLYQLNKILQLLVENNLEITGLDLNNDIYYNKVGEWCIFALENIVPCNNDNRNNNTLQVFKTFILSNFPQFKKFLTNNTNINAKRLASSSLSILKSFQHQIKAQYKLIQLFDFLQNEFPFITDNQEQFSTLIQWAKILLPDVNGATILDATTPNLCHKFIMPFFNQYLLSNNNISQDSTNENKLLLLLLVTLSNIKHSDPAQAKTLVLTQLKCPNRQVRFLLLKFLPHYIAFFPKTSINKELYPLILTGLSDENLQIKVNTLKVFEAGDTNSLLSQLDLKIINNDFLRHLANLQNIRTNINKGNYKVKLMVLDILCNDILDKLIDYQGADKALLIVSTALIKTLNQPAESTRVKLHCLKLINKKLISNKGKNDISDEDNKINDWPIDILINKLLSGVAPIMMDGSPKVRKLASQVFKKICTELERKVEETIDSTDYTDEQLNEESSDENDICEINESLNVNEFVLVREMVANLGLDMNNSFYDNKNSNKIESSICKDLGDIKINNTSYNKLATPDESLWDQGDNDDDDDDNWNTEDDYNSVKTAKPRTKKVFTTKSISTKKDFKSVKGTSNNSPKIIDDDWGSAWDEFEDNDDNDLLEIDSKNTSSKVTSNKIPTSSTSKDNIGTKVSIQKPSWMDDDIASTQPKRSHGKTIKTNASRITTASKKINSQTAFKNMSIGNNSNKRSVAHKNNNQDDIDDWGDDW
ncbi:COPI-interacting protein CEX1 SCDLUD_002899 [Saccharomycodes ludwigii]|uniref:COPI-interacting protein CEX1 n=1 Tax=Saccharomycodes ludwigii TaxID=36035 RepID=UPI001E87A6CF|nr:hypothetical protein SCDLUD_002899 [Saccharomycodes ludwigii]KAH3901407.1 hypothetical protein SCDLUD_002899 [Saccharomycodes ludwigii]